MKITILGCGGSAGVPLIGNNWGACDPAEPRNRRLRVSALVEEGAETLLIDTAPDMREQLLRADLQDLTAVLYTHAHADHTHGIDNLRSVNWLTGRSLPLYADAATMADLEMRFDYIFAERPAAKKFYMPSIIPHVIDDTPFDIGELTVASFRQAHGKGFSRGYRLGAFGYSTDVSALDDFALETLRGVKTWVVGCIREKPHPTHAHLAKVLEWVDLLKPARTILTHMDHSMDYRSLSAKLPPGVEAGYDGMVLVC